jgi:glycosyltransferase involved in cell wall biosynthesis
VSRLLSINNYYYVRGGAEAVFLEHNKMFENLGWDVVPFCMKHEKNFRTPWEEYFVDEIELGSSYGTLEKLSKSLKAIYSWEAMRKLDAILDKARPEIAHAHNIYHHLSPSILRRLSRREVPTVLTLHDLKIACPSYRMIANDSICERCKVSNYWQAARTRCMHGSFALSAWATAEAYFHRIMGSYRRYVDQFIVPSRFYIDKFCEWGWDRDKFVHIPNFVDTDAITPRFEPGEYFVFFGRLSPEKGVGTFIRAVAKTGVRARVIGTGPEEANLQALARECGAPVEFLGYKSGEELFELIRSARAVVLPSEWYENAPISVLEAFAAGKPVLGANIGGIPEVLDHRWGRVFEAFSVEALADCLNEIAGLGSQEVAKMGESAREYVSTIHSRQSYIERCQDVYSRLTGNE